MFDCNTSFVFIYSYVYSITYSECVFLAVVMRHSRSMSHIVLSSVACQDLPHFFALAHRVRFSEKKLLNMKCVFGCSIWCLP